MFYSLYNLEYFWNYISYFQYIRSLIFTNRYLAFKASVKKTVSLKTVSLKRYL